MGAALANGKVILFGEHAAVYDRPAMAVGIPEAMVLGDLSARDRGVRVRVAPWDLEVDERDPGPLGTCLRLLETLLPTGGAGMDVAIEARIPARAGLGSSAALSVALVRCLAQVRRLPLDDGRVQALAHRLEDVFHGGASGLDDTVAAYGGACLFKRAGFRGTDVQAANFRRLSDQAIQLDLTVPDLLFVDSGVERSTRDMVAGVRQRWEADGPGVEALFDGMESCLAAGLAGMQRRDALAVGRAMDDNHSLLAGLGVSHPVLEQLVEAARAAGAVGAKLTGAGGGGGVIALAPGREREVLAAWRACGRTGFHLRLAGGEASA